jgi:hypothetical protein
VTQLNASSGLQQKDPSVIANLVSEDCVMEIMPPSPDGERIEVTTPFSTMDGSLCSMPRSNGQNPQKLPVTGFSKYARTIERNVEQARFLADLIERHLQFRLLTANLNIACFQFVLPGFCKMSD